MIVFPFGEGRTDKYVFDYLYKKYILEDIFEDFRPVGGITNFYKEIKKVVASDLYSNPPADDICILAFCDLDKGCNRIDVINKFRTIFKKLLPEWNGEPKEHSTYGNIYFFEQVPNGMGPGLRLILHIADVNGFQLPETVKQSNNTTDGYVLAVGLKMNVLHRFAVEDTITTEANLHNLITECIARCFHSSGIIFEQDKDYLAAYLCATRFWVKHRTEDDNRLTKTILERAWNNDQDGLKNVFASWIEAMICAGEPLK